MDYSYEIGTCKDTGIKLVYRELTEEMKNHPKFRLIQELYREDNDGNSPTSPTTQSGTA